MANLCPSCQADLPAGSINTAEGVALCPACGELTRLRTVAKSNEDSPSPAPPGPPPPGCRVVDDGVRARLVVSLRSPAGALVMLGVAAFWNGIVSVFVSTIAARWWTRLVGPVPEWMPQPPIRVIGVELDESTALGLGMLIFLTLFITPFVVVGLGFIAGVLLSIAGRIEITLGDIRASVFTGVGPVGLTRRFDPRGVRSVRIKRPRVLTAGQRTEQLVIEADRTIRTASTCRDEQRRWLAAELRHRLHGHTPE